MQKTDNIDYIHTKYMTTGCPPIGCPPIGCPPGASLHVGIPHPAIEYGNNRGWGGNAICRDAPGGHPLPGHPLPGHHMWSRPATTIARIACVIIVIFLAFLAFPHFASARSLSGSGHIYGQLLDGTKRNAPVAGQNVTLQMAQGQNASDLASATTDAQGRFSFENLSTDKTISYALYSLYQGAQYVSDLIDLSSKASQSVNLTVYEATSSAKNLAIVQASVLIGKADAQHGLLTISESISFDNLGLTTYVGSLQAKGQKPNALLFSLPGGARQLSLKSGFDGYHSIQVNTGFATDAAVPPGVSQFAFSFQVPYSGSHYDFGYTITYPTVALVVLVPLDYHASSSGLTTQGTTNVNSQSYQQWSAKQALANTQIHLELDGLPATGSAPSTSSSSAPDIGAFLIVAAVMVIIVIITLIIYFQMQRRARGRRRTGTKKGAPGRAAAGRSAISAKGEKHSQEAQLLAELLALDKTYEAGTIKKAEYQERRASLKARLRTVIQEENGQKAGSKKAARSGKGNK